MHVEETVAAEKEKCISGLLESLRAIFDKLKDFYAAKEDAQQHIAREIDKMVSELDAGQFEEGEALKNRKINEIGSYIKTLVELYSALGMRSDVIGLVDMRTSDRFSLKRDFIVKFLVAIEEFGATQTVDDLIRIKALVKAYERMEIVESIEQEAVIMHCQKFIDFFNSNLMACIRSDGAIQGAILDEICDGVESLLGSLKLVVKA